MKWQIILDWCSYESGTWTSPLRTPSIQSWGSLPSIVQPTDWAVPRISLTVPSNFLAMERSLIVLAMLSTSLNVIFPLCLTVIEKKCYYVLVLGYDSKASFLLIICTYDLRINNYSLFFCFFRSRGGSFKALMMSEAAEGTTEIVACRFWIVSLTVIFRPFQSPVAFAMSSPTFFGDWKRNQNVL